MRSTIINGLLTMGLVLSAQAAETIKVQAVFLEHPAAMMVTKQAWERGLGKKSGVEVLSQPVVITKSGEPAAVSITAAHEIADAVTGKQRVLHSGPELQVLPQANGEKIEFTGSATVRHREGIEKGEDTQVTEFSVREYYFSGRMSSGGTIVLSSKSVYNKKRLSVLLTLTKI